MLCGVKVVPKKDFTSFDVAAVVQELKKEIWDSRVNNVYQLDAKTLLLKLHKADKPPLRLILEAGRRLHLTSYALEAPPVPPAFCMALRKYLPGSWVINVEQYEFERIAAVSFKTKQGPLKLIVELFGEGNLILIDERNIILQALIYKRMRDRNIVRNEIFQLPPSSGKNPLKITKEELADGLCSSGKIEIVKALARFLGVGGLYSEEMLLRAQVDKTKLCNELTDLEVEAIFNSLRSLLEPLENGKLEPCIVLDENGSFVDVVPLKLNRYEGSTIKPYDAFNSALDEFYLKVTVTEKATSEIPTEGLKKEVEKLKRVVADQERVLSEANEKAERYKRFGDTVYAYSIELQALLDKFSSAKNEGKDWNAVASEVKTAKAADKSAKVLVEGFDARNLLLNVCVDSVRFGLGLRKSLFENAAGFYEQGKKVKQKSAGALTALEESRKKLADAEKRLSEAETLRSAKPLEAMAAIAERKVKSKEWYEKFHWFISSEGFLVVAGKDAVSNEVLIKKYTAPDDIVFHADIVGSPFAVVKTNHQEPGEQTLHEAAEFAAAFSRAWREGMGSADVYWVKPEQLSKSGPSGEYVAHGAFAVSGKRNWLRNVPLRLSIGIIEEEEATFMGGPLDAVKAKTKVYATITSGETTGKEFLLQILRSLTLKLPKEQREKVGKASAAIEKIREFVPYTKGRVVVVN